MRRKIKFLVISVLLVMSLVACNKGDSKETTTNVEVQSEISGDETESGFDIERVRKNVVIKGHKMEIPMKLKDLDKDFTWEEFGIASEGEAIVDVLYDKDLMVSFEVRNYYKGKEDEGEAYYVIADNPNCVIDGIIPTKTTEQEIINKYGNPDKSVVVSSENNVVSYRYGDIEEISYPSETKIKCLRVTIEDGIVTEAILICGNKE